MKTEMQEAAFKFMQQVRSLDDYSYYRACYVEVVNGKERLVGIALRVGRLDQVNRFYTGTTTVPGIVRMLWVHEGERE